MSLVTAAGGDTGGLFAAIAARVAGLDGGGITLADGERFAVRAAAGGDVSPTR